ncbi:hypothetical protein POM88_029127 [Heracleum sosnowskyi]|uniref:CCHC-type domain-containing protein n=1 Tax=Heracleum sosnowskyi TaxID=360622 RepID=A0AAD8MHD6_9APIA|nr:hypothetical protein POM88_029127 [Heracleum sosnowskyi]
MNGEVHWKKSGYIVKPPFVHQQPGRPVAKKRHDGNDLKDLQKKTDDDGKVLKKKGYTSVRCSSCNQLGHNKRTCKDRQLSTTGDGRYLEEDTYQDCVLEMDLPDAPAMT